jgi:chorismate synthase
VKNQTPAGEIELRDLQGIQEMAAAEELQKIVWESEKDYDNKDILLAIQHAGGLVGGAFVPGNKLIGFVFAFPTIKPHVFHSHRLAVLPEWRSRNLGERLKWYQRDWSLIRGVDVIQWTYDPLRTINANLNIHRLGATSNTYYEEYYGEMDGINAGAPSDRIMVNWHIKSQRVLDRIQTPPRQDKRPEAAVANPCRDNLPGEEILTLQAPIVRINIPDNFSTLLVDNRDLALKWRLHTRHLLQSYFSQGYQITDFTRLDGAAYLLEKLNGGKQRGKN